MRKTRLYADSSVISEMDATEHGEITARFFAFTMKANSSYEILISPVVDEEISETEEEKRKNIYARLKTLILTKIEKNNEAEELALGYLKSGVLTEKHMSDLRHVDYAVVTHCGCVISWNLKHLSNLRTIQRVNNHNHDKNLSRIFIATPTIIVGE